MEQQQDFVHGNFSGGFPVAEQLQAGWLILPGLSLSCCSHFPIRVLTFGLLLLLQGDVLGGCKVEVWAVPGAGADCATNVPTDLPMVCV